MLWPVERNLLARRAVVDDHRQRSPETHEKLVASPMRVLSSHVFSRHIEDDEVAFGGEGDLLRELADREAAAKIREHRKTVNCDAAHRCLPDTLIRRGHDLRRRGRFTFGVDVADDARRIAGYHGARGNIVGDDRAGADHRARTDTQSRQNRGAASDRRAAADVVSSGFG
jgi:hypothetical protein